MLLPLELVRGRPGHDDLDLTLGIVLVVPVRSQLHDGVVQVYTNPAGDFPALKDVCLDVYQGEFLGITGKSGAGKTTLLNMISGVSEISSGEVLFSLQNKHKNHHKGTVETWGLCTSPLS